MEQKLFKSCDGTIIMISCLFTIINMHLIVYMLNASVKYKLNQVKPIGNLNNFFHSNQQSLCHIYIVLRLVHSTDKAQSN